MVDLFEDRLTFSFSQEIDKKIAQICAEKPEIMKNRERVVLWNQDAAIDGLASKRYWFTLDRKEIACFWIAIERDADKRLQIKASDIIYPQN